MTQAAVKSKVGQLKELRLKLFTQIHLKHQTIEEVLNAEKRQARKKKFNAISPLKTKLNRP